MTGDEAADFCADPANREPSGPPVRLRRLFRCPHMSVGNVAAASCGQCGPLKAARA